MRRFYTVLAVMMMASGARAGAQTSGQAITARAVPAPATEVDGAKLVEARRVVARLMPPGVYKTVMGSAMSPMLDNMNGVLKALPLKQIAEMGGLDAKQADALGNVDIEQVMAIYDPYWQQRTRLSTRAMFDAMGDFFTTFEPEMREAMAEAYARHFTIEDLRNLNGFFATPSGSKFATRYMTIMTDPAMADEMKAMMLKMTQHMPEFVAAAQKATASLPPPRSIESLTPAQKERLGKLLGVTPQKLRDPKPAT